MFSRLKKSIESFSNSLAEKFKTKEIKPEDFDEIGNDFLLELVENDVAYSVAEEIINTLKNTIIGKRVPKNSDIKESIKEALVDFIKKNIPEPDLDIIEAIKNKQAKEKKPFIIIFMGINGVGKTTSIAKLANYIKKNGMTPLIVAADTFRAGSQEQLQVHADRLGVPIIRAKYNSDPASIAFDGIAYAEKKNIPVVLIDTAGRMHVDRDLINELKKIIDVVGYDLRLLVIDALSGNDSVEQAIAYEKNVGYEGFFLTKSDADTKGGVALSISVETKKPIYFLGTGQNYDDIVPFNKEWLIKTLLGEK
ncbi:MULTISPECIES: signal recognition particle-docking protein FtsY [Fervidicoccus]|uniref:Putative signal recognition particle protein n=1 Tax=Fervidicoccus fontis (strain DSM 19380 / JCM 18336 / VKM B-2539 / Kam940) TaxID=1163730 RepID=I0A2P5_FERFK|nr:signal recognition particle-docking protein FtsY [Fervidicoccus fontis]AFH43252.1 putative signal recognition particle protein [Fervidicoccus fontis Kam940]